MSARGAIRTVALGRKTVVAILLASAASVASARTHRIYPFDRSRGLPTTSVHGIGQDHRGFLWVGGTRSLFRYDGRDFVRWHEGLIAGSPEDFADDPVEGLLVKLSYPSLELVRVTDAGLEPFTPAIDPPLDRVWDIVSGEAGGLWIADAEGLRHRDAEGEWRTWPPERFRDRRPHRMTARPGGGVIVSAGSGVYRVRPGGDVEPLVEAPEYAVAAYENASGGIFVAHGGGKGGNLARLEEGRLVLLADSGGRATDLAIRGDAVWMSLDVALIRWHPRDGVDRWRADGGAYSGGGRFLLDHEESLWIGCYAGMVQLPEPATSIWSTDDGWPGASLEFLEQTQDELWGSTFQGHGVIRERDGILSVEMAMRGFSPFPLCRDADDRIWHARREPWDAPSEFFESYRGSNRSHRPERAGDDGACGRARDGHVWLARGGVLYATPRGGGMPREAGVLPPDLRVHGIHELDDGTMWLISDPKVCRTDEVPPQHAWAWSCENNEPWILGRSMVRPTPGELWVASKEGLLRRTAVGWSVIDGFANTEVRQLVPSPRGGIWVVALEFVFRVLPDPNDPGRVDIVERLTLWQGLPDEGGHALVESDDGTIWLATRRGLTQIPPEVRDQALPVPSVELVGLNVAGEARTLDGNGLDLPHDLNDVEVAFAAMTFRNRGLVRYRVRSSPDDPWRETRTPSFRFADLAPGDYRPQVAASLDGEHWTATPAGVSIHIAAPWHASWPTRLAFLALAFAGLYALYRARLAVQLQVERQRTRIAMDLHDEMGSGLGSIRILSDVLDQDDLPSNDRREVIGQIQHASEELSVALADIVWSLRPRARTLDAVVTRIETLARRLLPSPAVLVHFVTEGVDGSTVLSQPVCKNVLAIASEALHNTAKHAVAKTVTVGLERRDGRLELTVADDGAGFDAASRRGDGLGLTSMARRAADIGAAVDVRSRPGEGTTVTLRFDAKARDRRVLDDPTGKKGEPR